MILIFILTNYILLPDEHWLGLIVSLLFLFGLFIVINWAFQSDKKAYFEEQGKIPLNDDTLAEKYLLAQKRKNPLDYKEFDA